MSITIQNLKNLPDAPGVYFFLGKRKNRKARPCPRLSTLHAPQGQALRLVIHNREVLYIGKAGSLRDRVRSYFARDIVEARGAGIEQMVEKTEDIAYEKTDSVLEAVLLEAELIKKYQPKYNVREKDDKSFNYVAITKEDFPRVILIRGRELTALRNKTKLTTKDYGLKTIFGPFPHGGILREALSIIRKIFPYRDKCTPLSYPKSYSNILQNIRISNHKKSPRAHYSHVLPPSHNATDGQGKNIGIKNSKSKPCFNHQIGLCPGVCVGAVSKKEYAKTIRNITDLFKGKKKEVLKNLNHEMNAAAKGEDFERAAKIRNTIFALEHIQDVSLLRREPRAFTDAQTHIRRIEAYDVAHISGKEIVGVMVTIYGGEPDKSAYRKFKIRTVLSSNDTAALKEVLERRLTHAEWPFPALVVVDGGKAQMNVAVCVLEEAGVPAAVVGVVKDERHRPKHIIGNEDARKEFENEILLANSEAHRFAIGYHRERMRRR